MLGVVIFMSNPATQGHRHCKAFLIAKDSWWIYSLQLLHLEAQHACWVILISKILFNKIILYKIIYLQISLCEISVCVCQGLAELGVHLIKHINCMCVSLSFLTLQSGPCFRTLNSHCKLGCTCCNVYEMPCHLWKTLNHKFRVQLNCERQFIMCKRNVNG